MLYGLSNGDDDSTAASLNKDQTLTGPFQHCHGTGKTVDHATAHGLLSSPCAIRHQLIAEGGSCCGAIKARRAGPRGRQIDQRCKGSAALAACGCWKGGSGVAFWDGTSEKMHACSPIQQPLAPVHHRRQRMIANFRASNQSMDATAYMLLDDSFWGADLQAVNKVASPFVVN